MSVCCIIFLMQCGPVVLQSLPHGTSYFPVLFESLKLLEAA